MLAGARILLVAVIGCFAAPGAAQESCLSAREARAAVSQGRALDFARVKRSVELATGGDVLRARLCHHEGRLVYNLTLLRPGGQVVAMWVDAANGEHGPAELALPQWLERRDGERSGN